MEVDYTQKHVLTACQDRNIRVYSVKTSKHTKTFKGSVGEDGSLIKVSKIIKWPQKYIKNLICLILHLNN